MPPLFSVCPMHPELKDKSPECCPKYVMAPGKGAAFLYSLIATIAPGVSPETMREGALVAIFFHSDIIY